MLALAICSPASAQPENGGVIGSALGDALRQLQRLGLPVVFSSELVTPQLRVPVEPRSRGLRGRLDELLAPHALSAVSGPGGTLLVVRARPVAARSSESPRRATPVDSRPAHSATDAPGQGPSPAATHQERVTVEARPDLRSGSLPLPEHRLSSSDLARFGGYAVQDPVKAAQSLPGVSGADDFGNALSVRASQPRHASLVVDGVAAPWLQHLAAGRGDAGAVTMIGGDVVDEAALHVGGYARRDGSQLGPQLDLTLREGRRAAPGVKVGASTTGTHATGEGPVGERGSWLVGVRTSHSEWPLGRQDEERTVFGYADVQSKIAFDATPSQRLAATVIAGRSAIERDDPGGAMADGVNQASLLALAWQSTLEPSTVLRQQVFVLSHAFSNQDSTRRMVNEGEDRAVGYRIDVTRPVAGVLVDAGLQAKRLSGLRRGPGWPVGPVTAGPPTTASKAAWTEGSAYVSGHRELAPGVTVAPGLRISYSTFGGQRVADRWLEAQWAVSPTWLMHGSAAVVHQFADTNADAWPAVAAGADPEPERARLLEVGIGHRLAGAWRWRATAFARDERDIVPSRRWGTRDEGRYSGDARGIDLTIERRAGRGLAGWLAYSYVAAHYAGADSGERFPADYAQRHSFNASASWPLPGAITTGFTFKAGSPRPLPGSLEPGPGRGLVLGERRNLAELPAYARLDLRAERPVVAFRHRVVIFGEVLNVLDRENLGLAAGHLVPGTRQVVGATERLFPRLATIGVNVTF